MRALFLAVVPIGCFLIGFFVAKLSRPSVEVRRLRNAENLIDELSVMAGEHQQYGDTFATLAMGKIIDYRTERNQI